jgi:hypothetical protein
MSLLKPNKKTGANTKQRQTGDMKNIVLSLIVLLGSSPIVSWASGAGSSAGLSLITEGSARASALGTAYTGVVDDIAGLAYNPASPASLSQGQASFMYQNGLIEDRFGLLMLGMPLAHGLGGFGLSVGYYDAGTLELIDETGASRSVNAQRDVTAQLAYAHTFGRTSLGIAGKYITSTLAGEYTANAMAADIGILTKVSSRLSLGASALNYGTKLTYLTEGDALPRTLRMGGSYALFPNRAASTSLLFDASYLSNEKQLSPALGLETLVGPLAIRAGYRKTGDTGEFTAGAGFALGRSSLDYAFGLINQLDTQHKVSVAMHFGASPASIPSAIVRPIDEPRVRKVRVVKTAPPAVEEEAEPVARVERTVSERPARAHALGGETILRAPRQQRRVYVIQEGDTLASIAQDELGDKRQWKTLYSANQHLIDDPAAIEVGMRIVIPMSADNQ